MSALADCRCYCAVETQELRMQARVQQSTGFISVKPSVFTVITHIFHAYSAIVNTQCRGEWNVPWMGRQQSEHFLYTVIATFWWPVIMNKLHRSFTYTAWRQGLLLWKCTNRCRLPSLSRNINPSKPSGHYMYRQFNIQQFHILPTQCIYVFCVDLRTNSDYFPIQH